MLFPTILVLIFCCNSAKCDADSPIYASV